MTAARTAATTAMLALTTPWVKPSHLAAAGGRRAAGHGATQRDVEDLLERMREDLDGAAHDAAGEDDVLSMLDRYSSAIREFAALREGDLETAEETDEERVDPAFEALDGHVKEMIEDEERDAATDSRQALVGSLLVIVISSSALLDLTLATLHARGRLARSELQRATVRESEKRMQALLRNSSDLLLVLDADGSVRYASESVDRLLGHRADDLLGRDVRELLDDADRMALTSQLERASAQPGRPVVTEWALRGAQGRCASSKRSSTTSRRTAASKASSSTSATSPSAAAWKPSCAVAPTTTS